MNVKGYSDVPSPIPPNPGHVELGMEHPLQAVRRYCRPDRRESGLLGT